MKLASGKNKPERNVYCRYFVKTTYFFNKVHSMYNVNSISKR